MNVDRVFESKIARLRGGASPRVLDLFAGCGGISLGFQAAGFDVVAALEWDAIAARSHARNFHGRSDNEFAVHSDARDITAIEPEDFASELGLDGIDTSFDVVVGGPPCQAYARVGRAKLRDVVDHPEAFKIDPRANLYTRYLHYVRAAKPLAVVMENVPDILNFGGHNVVQEIVEILESDGYVARYSLINSAHHGVPQMRDRVFMIALRRELGVLPSFPAATHHCDLPIGYLGTRRVALKHIQPSVDQHFVAADTGGPHLPPAVTAKDALADLPAITLHQKGLLKRGARRFTELARYRVNGKVSSYAEQMRNWPGFSSEAGVYDHVLRCLPRDTEIFRNMQSGDEYPAAHRVATTLFSVEAERRGFEKASIEWESLHRAMVPPYPVTSFPNRWWKLRPDAPSRTLLAHLGKDTYSHIHYDSKQARVISVREAARLQSFPDGFVFEGTMNPAFRQIGNAVPPLMAKAIGEEVIMRVNEGVALGRESIAA